MMRVLKASMLLGVATAAASSKSKECYTVDFEDFEVGQTVTGVSAVSASGDTKFVDVASVSFVSDKGDVAKYKASAMIFDSTCPKGKCSGGDDDL
eukprot:CAMPEP_0198649562 /NCGR_PEP_ID=MMETSP1467-20131203/4356_1 /TAXON_ID=1462469 /ORGANISM="unid. sp., Strain CCMP2135" /LENGTH=94 /DNA_ID=CAMNT_0044385357 /DNA_START=85 /DNA_END=365 /DNA_ORIENTATION=+